ncbi:MAG: archaellin/type IV pilin N-terminal domain-containing protein [Candidatus Bathycorpusculaceae bacterium]
MNWKKALAKLAKQKRAMVGLEAAIILIAFVIIAGAFSFMVINQGLFATERGKTVVQDSLRQSSTPLVVDGSIMLNATSATGIDGIVIPLRAYGVKYIALGKNETAVTLTVGGNAWPNIYNGTDKMAVGRDFDYLLGMVGSGNATLFIQNSNGDEALDSNEKGYLVVHLSSAASARTHIVVEIKPEKAAPLTIDFYVPESLQTGWMSVAG